MNRNKLIFFLIVGFISINSNAQWVSFGTSSTKRMPQTKLISNDKNSTIIKIEISGFEKNSQIYDGVNYDIIDLKTDVFSQKVGSPSLPQISKIIAIPDDKPVSVEIIETGEVFKYKNIHLPPTRRSWVEGEPETTYIKDNNSYGKDQFFPIKLANVNKPAVFRDFRIVRLAISPVQYNPVTKEIKITSSITIRLNYNTNADVINPKTSPRRAIAPSFDKLYRSTIFNYASVLKNSKDLSIDGNELMLCIIPDALYNDFLPYADWKKRSGINMHLTKFSDIGATASNPIPIKNHISDAYYNWSIPPTYILLVGDSDKLPIKYVSYDYTFIYENYFVEIDGDDYLPEMMIGRFTNKDSYGLKVMINKFTKYEKEPYIDGSGWFKKATCCSNNFYPSQVTTKEFTRDIMLNDGDFTSVDAYMSSTYCSADTDDVIYAINEGRSYLNYRGEGWFYGWEASCTPFYVANLWALNNGEKLTFFSSIGCGVAMFNIETGNCFGEELMEMGTLTEPKGAIAFIGPTSNTHTTFNNKIDKGIYIGMFQENMDTPGEALLRGKLYMYNVFGEYYDGGDGYNSVEYHYRVFTVLGDPSIHIWKNVPLAVSVNHTTSVIAGLNTINVSVNYADSGLPVKNSQVTLTNANDLFITGFTDDSGSVNLIGNIPNEGNVNVTARGIDVIPYQGTINVVLGTDSFSANLSRLISIPNPISSGGGTDIIYSLAEKNNTSIKIYNNVGQLVRELQNKIQTSGNHSIHWDGLNDNGEKLSTGLYYCQLVSGNLKGTIKILIQE